MIFNGFFMNVCRFVGKYVCLKQIKRISRLLDNIFLVPEYPTPPVMSFPAFERIFKHSSMRAWSIMGLLVGCGFVLTSGGLLSPELESLYVNPSKSE